MGKRLSDTAAIVSAPTPNGSNTSVSQSVRQIDNGYIVCNSECGPEGYKSREYYSPTPPKEPSRDRMVGSENLKGAMRALKE